MGGGCSWYLFPNSGDGCADLESMLAGLTVALRFAFSVEELLVREFFLEDNPDPSLEPGLDPGGVGVGSTRTAPGILSGLTLGLLGHSPKCSSSASFMYSSSTFFSKCMTFSLTFM